MKQINKVWFLLAGIVAISCVKQEETVPEAQEYVTIQASLDVSATKTYLDGVQVKWEADDEIALWYGILNTSMDDELYTVASIDGGDARQATFHGFAPAGAWDAYMGVYPYSACDGCSKEGKLTVTLPSVQTAEADGFAPGSNVAVAYSATTDLTFQNVGALLAVQITDVGGHTVTSLRLTGTSALSGQVEIEQATLPAVDAVVAGEDYVELTGTIAAGNTYYFVVLPGSHTGFTLTLTDSDGNTATATSTHAYDITRNSNTLIANLTVGEGNWVAPAPPIAKTIFINEVDCKNKKIELYNSTDAPVDLSTWTIYKQKSSTGSTDSWAFSNFDTPAATIPAGGYLVLTAKQKDAANGPTFGLSNEGFILWLQDGGGVEKDCIDNGSDNPEMVTVPDGSTYGRVLDGMEAWMLFVGGSIGSANNGYAGIRLNEVNGNDYNAENSNDKFVEIYNAGPNTVSLSGCTMEKDGSVKWTGDASHVLAPDSYLVLYSSKSEGAKTCSAADIFDSGLSAKSAVRVQLFNPAGTSIDDFNLATKPASAAPASYGRNGDGGWYYQVASPGGVNYDGVDAVSGLE